LDDLIYEIFNQFNKIYDYISPEELLGAKNRLKYRLLHEQTGKGRSKALNYQLQNLQRSVPILELFHRIDELTTCNLKELIGLYFYDVDPVVIAHGNLEEMPDYVVMRGWTYWSRW